MFNNFFTPEEISPRKKQAFKLNFSEAYDFSSLLQKDLFQIVSPHIESIMDQKRKIIGWLKKIPLIERMHVLTFTNKQFVCLIRAMYQKKQSQYQDNSSIAFAISYYQQKQQFLNDNVVTSLIWQQQQIIKDYQMSIKMLKMYFYLQFYQELLNNILIMSRYTQFDSITFSQEFIRNIDRIFQLFEVLGDGIAHQLTQKDYQRLKQKSNSVMFYDQQHCLKKATVGTWITEVFMKDISMKYFQSSLNTQSEFHNELKQKSKQFQKYWKIVTPERKNQIIKKVLQMKPLDLYQQHRIIIKVTRNGFPPIQKSDKVPLLLKNILNASQKQIFYILFYTNLSQTLQSHSILKYYIALQLEEQIKRYNELQSNLQKETKMKKKKNKNKEISKSQEDHIKKINQSSQNNSKNQEIKQKSNLNSQNSKFQNEQNNKIKKQQKQKKQIFLVKGTDLFYKKLEISQTQQIICIESSYQTIAEKSNIISVGNQEQKQENNKKKKKQKKRKNKNSQKTQENSIVNISQNPASDQQSSLKQISKVPANDKQMAQIINNIQKTSLNKTLQIDRNSQKSSETTNDHLQQQQENQQKKEKQLIENLKPIALEHKHSEDCLSQFLKETQKTMVFYSKQRKIIINRLSYVFAQHQLSFKLYGSSTCQAALPSSDIDIVVDPSIVNYFYFSYSNYRKKIINSLEYLQKVFQKFQWAEDFLLLPGATIPLLTFTVNPGVEFEFQQGNYQYNNKKQLKQQIKISVDITIQPYINMTDEVPMHLGMESTELIKQWISIFPYYKEMLILLKLFTKNQNLNKMYHGGISSFMQAIVLAGFYKNFFVSHNSSLNEFQYKRQKFEQIIPLNFSLSKMFAEYCLFIQKFQEDKEILDINSNNSILLKPSTLLKEQLGIINPLTGQIMSQRCTTFPLYKKMLEKVFQILRSKNQNEIREDLNIIFQV